MNLASTQTTPWLARDLNVDDWLIRIPGEVIEELVCFAEQHDALDFHSQGEVGAEAGLAGLVRTRQVLAEARDRLERGHGFVVLDHVPVNTLTEYQCRVVAWALFSCMGRVVDQKVSGTKVYDVQDKGVELEYGVRRSITNLDQEFHTDAGWLDAPPEMIGLFCRAPAEIGGLNQLMSLVGAHESMREEHPEQLKRLYQPFYWDRQAEHAPDESKMSAQPVFYEEDGKVNARYYDDYIRNGQGLADEPLDSAGEEALATFRSVVGRKERMIEFGLQAGQFLLVNNREVAHSRSEFSGPEGRRSQHHYFRLWSRRKGATTLDG